MRDGLRALQFWGATALCSLGLMGTMATAKAEPWPTEVEIAQATVVTAPTGLYEATLGETKASSRAATEDQRLRRSRTVEAFEDTPVQIQIDAYATQEELNAIAAAETLVEGITSFRMGSLTIGSLVYPVNVALSARVGETYVISLLSTQAFAAKGTGGGLAGAGGVGLALLTVPTDGSAGTGRLYTTVQAGISSGGEVEFRGGRTTATPLLEVQGVNLQGDL